MSRRPIAGLAVAALIVLAGCRPAAPDPAVEAAPAPAPAASPAAAAPAARVRNVDGAGAAGWLAEHPETVVLDVRTPDEFASGHIAGATNLDYHGEGFAERLAALNRETTYLVHCKSGRRSAATQETMTELGFQSLVHLDGGIDAWTAAGQAITK